MAQTQRLTSYACTVHSDGDDTFIVTHQTEVVRFNAARIILNSGGWRTKKTKDDMNRASNQFQLGYTVFQKNYEWFVATAGETIPFKDHMVICRDHRTYRIRHPEGGYWPNFYWSNEHSWVEHLTDATIFTANEQANTRLPMHGFWETN